MKTPRPGDCEQCGAIAPAGGVIEHAWDCPRINPGAARDLRDVIAERAYPPRSPEEAAAELLRMARVIEAAWAARYPDPATPDKQKIPARLREYARAFP